jgi:hypothetical protein
MGGRSLTKSPSLRRVVVVNKTSSMLGALFQDYLPSSYNLTRHKGTSVGGRRRLI